jgi:acetyl-CoA acetyltransferase
MRASSKAVIAGIGATEFSKDSGRSELQLALEAVKSALDDAGMRPSDVRGLVTFAMDTNNEIFVAHGLGMGELSFLDRIDYGGGSCCATVHHAAMAVEAGIADVVVCYRAFNERSGHRFGMSSPHPRPDVFGTNLALYRTFGLATAASWSAMVARRYMTQYGATSEDFGRVAVLDRQHAQNNPHAWFYQRPITLDDHQASRLIADPLRMMDCCQESDGGVAFVVTSLERANDAPHRPAVIRAAAQASAPGELFMTNFYRDDITQLPEVAHCARQVFAQSGLGPDDMSCAIIYDHFTPWVLMQLEEYGFCGRGEAKDFIRAGNLELGGKLPTNMHGGLLGEAYIHGLNGIAEAVRQVRGTSVNQVAACDHVLVTGGTGVPTSALILGQA